MGKAKDARFLRNVSYCYWTLRKGLHIPRIPKVLRSHNLFCDGIQYEYFVLNIQAQGVSRPYHGVQHLLPGKPSDFVHDIQIMRKSPPESGKGFQPADGPARS